jgi:hypothetical protein
MEVKVYRNLHKSCWSVVALKGDYAGKVIAHADEVQLTHANFKVSEAGRQRVLAERQKNIHAFVSGDLHAWNGVKMRRETDVECPGGECISIFPGMDRSVSYNPYRGGTFFDVGTGTAVTDSPFVALTSDREVICR